MIKCLMKGINKHTENFLVILLLTQRNYFPIIFAWEKYLRVMGGYLKYKERNIRQCMSTCFILTVKQYYSLTVPL